MTYSCSDFVDTVLDALGVEVPDESADSPSDQADLALEAIAKRPVLNDREFATVLAALRYWQRCGNRGSEPEIEIAELNPMKRPSRLGPVEIDALCERLNSGE